jgi:hypothetical protein
MAGYSSTGKGVDQRPRLDTTIRSGRRDESTGMLLVTRTAGALAVLGMGALHLQQYLGAEYSSIPTIGTLFVLNFAGSLVIALGLLMPLERLLPRRGAAATTFLSLLGAAMGAISIAFLLISESTPLFGFMEAGYRTPVVVALAFEGAAVVLLTAFAIARFRRRNG